MTIILVTLFLSGCDPILSRVRYACPSSLQTHTSEDTTSFWENAESYTGPQFDFGTEDRPSPDGWILTGVSNQYTLKSISIDPPNTPSWSGDWVGVRCTYGFGPLQEVHIRWELPPDASCKIDNSMQRVNGGVTGAVSQPYTALCVFPAANE